MSSARVPRGARRLPFVPLFKRRSFGAAFFFSAHDRDFLAFSSLNRPFALNLFYVGADHLEC
jgi:hypothetical protein